MISLELVPHSIETIQTDATWATNTFPDITAINIPDILRLPNRSYTVSKHLATTHTVIPHIRVIDFSNDDLIACMKDLKNAGINHVLLISGDPPPNPLQPIYKHSIPRIIEDIRREVPTITIYAGCDPYRQNLSKEIAYCQEKLDAGASGLFTQPIFNPHFAHMLIEQCQPCDWFIGISPVLTQRSFNYWITRNNVVFSPSFECSMSYNIAIGADLIALCKEADQHNYIMPIKTDISTYLPQLLHG